MSTEDSLVIKSCIISDQLDQNGDVYTKEALQKCAADYKGPGKVTWEHDCLWFEGTKKDVRVNSLSAWDAAYKHFLAVYQHYQKLVMVFNGVHTQSNQTNARSYFFDTLIKLMGQYETGIRTWELHDAMLGVKTEEPTDA